MSFLLVHIAEGKAFDKDLVKRFWSGCPGITQLVENAMIGAALGESFWQLTGAAREKVTQSNFIAATKLSETVVMIRSDDESFKTSLGEKGKIQNQLRTLLFPKSN